MRPALQTAAVPPGPPRRAPWTVLRSMHRDPLAFFAEAARHGGVAQVQVGLRRVFVVTSPDVIREVLVTRARDFIKDVGLQSTTPLLGRGLLTSEGDFHRRQRRLAQPAFHHARVASYGVHMVQRALAAQARWQDGEPLDVDREMMRLALAIVGKTLFDTEVEEESERIAEALAVAMETFSLGRAPFWRVLDALPLQSTRNMRRARADLDAIVFRLIREHRAAGRDRGDLLSTLLASQDEDGSRMTDAQVRDEAITLLLAGHETTANMLAWTWHLLAENPAVEARLHAELEVALGGRDPTMEDLPRLGYVERVLSESMRLCPPAWAIGRQATVDTVVGGFPLRKGWSVGIPQWVLHRDPALWPDPLRFDPDRFLPEAKAARHRFAYLPFGGGPRVCIGEGFAWTEGILVLATLARRWRMRAVPCAPPVAPQPLVTLRIRGGLRMRAERRPEARA